MRTPFDWYLNTSCLKVEIAADEDEIKEKSGFYYTCKRGIILGRQWDEDKLIDWEKELIAKVAPYCSGNYPGIIRCTNIVLTPKTNPNYDRCCTFWLSVTIKGTWFTLSSSIDDPKYDCS